VFDRKRAARNGISLTSGARGPDADEQLGGNIDGALDVAEWLVGSPLPEISVAVVDEVDTMVAAVLGDLGRRGVDRVCHHRAGMEGPGGLQPRPWPIRFGESFSVQTSPSSLQ
jgi:hypothetical protein